MDFILEFIDYAIGDDTDIVDLLPLVVLGFLLVAVRYLRSLVLRVLVELGALRERIDILGEIRRIGGNRENHP